MASKNFQFTLWNATHEDLQYIYIYLIHLYQKKVFLKVKSTKKGQDFHTKNPISKKIYGWCIHNDIFGIELWNIFCCPFVTTFYI